MSLYIRIAKGRKQDMNPNFLAEFAMQRGWNLIREYCDLSFADGESKELQGLIEASKRAEIDVLCCCEAGRGLEILRATINEICKNGTRFVLEDVNSPHDRLMFNLLSSISQYEKETIL